MPDTQTIVLDCGHGGKDPGAVSPTGLTEASVVLKDGLLLRERLNALAGDRLRVVLTREDDRFLTLTERANLANLAGADWFLSLHCNSAQQVASGFEAWTTPGQTAADPFATSLLLAYAAKFPGQPFRKDMSDGDPDKEAKFTVLMKTACPSVLFETGFLHTPDGDAWFRDPSTRVRRVDALATGILAHLGIVPAPAVVIPPTPEPTPGPGNTEAIRAHARAILDLLPSL